MSNNLRKLISLIPIENDDKFYGVYHRNSVSKKKLNLPLKKPLSLEISNFTPVSYQLNYTLEKNGKRPNFLPKIPKINLKFNQENNFPNIITNISTSNNSFIYHKPIEDEKSKKRPKINPSLRKFSINNIIFKEDISKKNSLSKSSSKQNIIYLEKKKNLINTIYENEMKQFKVYSKNMNEMIANQMVLEFFKKTRELRKLKSDDLMINYIQTNENKKNYYKRKISTADTSEQNNENINENKPHNLIIHNVFFEWVISNVIQRYINTINPLNENASIKFIRNILMNEVKNLSEIFFYKKKEKDIPRNMRIVKNIFAKYKINHENTNENKIKKEDKDLQLDVKRDEIKRQLLEKIMEKLVETDEQTLNNKINKIKNNKSVEVLNMQNNKGLNGLLYKNGNEEENNTTQEENNNNKNNIIDNQKKNIVQKVSVHTNTDSNLNTKYNKIEKKEIKKSNDNNNPHYNKDDDETENYGFYEPYYRYDRYDNNKEYKKQYRRNRNRQSIKDYIKSNKTESLDNSKNINVTNSQNSSPTPFKNNYRRLEPINYNKYINRSVNTNNKKNNNVDNNNNNINGNNDNDKNKNNYSNFSRK